MGWQSHAENTAVPPVAFKNLTDVFDKLIKFYRWYLATFTRSLIFEYDNSQYYFDKFPRVIPKPFHIIFLHFTSWPRCTSDW